ncbi:MAG: PD40 domain-containing protein [Actinobacteria bacterium]|nr:PD40 domain-containing protein [Actinomycetota bacterium]
MGTRRIYIIILILVLVLFLSVSALAGKCSLPGTEVKTGQPEEEEDAVNEESESGVTDGEKSTGNGAEDEEYYIAYFEVGSDENSMHFEHRVANVFAVSPDGTDKKLTYTDLDEKYDLSRIYAISPDGSKISCGFYEGGRGAYGALCVIDVAIGELDTVSEFDYTESESMELMKDIYGKPIWSHDGKKIAYEVICEPCSDNPRDDGIYIANIETDNIQAVDVNMDVASLESTTFLNPVLFSGNDSRLFNIFHTFYPKKEDETVLGYFTRNEKLVTVDISSGEAYEILDISQFEGMEANFDDFNLFTQQDKIVFQVLGDFEEDGDIWICDSDGSNLSKLTDNPNLREQQPSILDIPDSAGKVAYTRVDRYGTISYHFNSGDIYIINIDDSGQVKITDDGIDAAKPVFSPDGRYLAFIGYIYDSDMEYVVSSQIKVYDMQSGEIRTVASGSDIFDLIGWIKVSR